MHKKTISIAFFGTSITSHKLAVAANLASQQEITPVNSYARVTHHENLGFVRIFKNMAIAHYPSANIEVENYGVSGANILEIKDKVAEVLKQNKRFDFVYIEAGLNDILNRSIKPNAYINLEHFSREYAQVLKMLNKMSSHVNVMYSTPFSRYGISELNHLDATNLNLTLNQYNQEAKRLCELIKGQVINNHYIIAGLELACVNPFTDGLHLNDIGDTSVALNVLRHWQKDVEELRYV